MDACDPNADIENLRQLIKINTGVDVKLTKKEICQAYDDIQGGKLPLPPLVMNASRTYLVDKKSPLKPNDYELLFDSSTKRADLKRIARKVELKNVEQMTKSQIVDAIGKRLRYMKVHEPVKFARRSRVTVDKPTAVNENNTAVNNVNNTIQTNLNTNRVNNLNTNRVNTNRVNNLNTNRVNNLNTNRVNTNRVNTNRVNNLNTNRVNTNRVNINSPRASFGARPNGQRGVNFSRANVFRKGEKPAFLGGARRAVREPVRNNRPTNMNQRPVTMNNTPKKRGFFGGIFGAKKNQNFIPAKKFNGEKKGYVFKQGNQGLGYYKNTGNVRVQGPSLPSIKPQPIPSTLANTDLNAKEATAIIKKLGLRREKKFLERLALETVPRKLVVSEAQRALEEEKQFMAFIDELNLLNIESEYIKQRMAVDDLSQLRTEAQIKADERANVIRSDEEKMALFLESTNLNQKDKNAFLNRARKGNVDVFYLIEEVKRLISREVNRVLKDKRAKFRNILEDYNKLSNRDKEDLVKSIDEKTNTNTMKKLAENLIKKRIDEKKNLVAQNLLSFLTPLKINQANKNQFVKRFKNDDVNVNTLKREALNLEKTQISGKTENLRVKLNTRLVEIGLNQLNQNAIMTKFRNGNRNVEKLLEEAKLLKAQRNLESGNKAKQEYISYLNTLANLTNDDKKELIRTGNLNRNKALNLSKRRATEKKDKEKKEFIGFLADLGLTNENRTTMINKYNANKLNVDLLKQEAIQLRNGKISEKKAKLLAHMNGLGEVLTSENRRKLLNRVENTNLNTLKANANGIAKKRIGEKKEKERRELEAYINNLGLGVNNKRNILNQNLTLNNGKRLANTKLKEKQGRNQKIKNRKNLEAYINSLGLTTNDKVNILNKDPNLTEGKRLANNRIQMKIREKRNKNKTALSIYLNKLGLKNDDKNQFLTNLNNPNVNINAIKQRANAFVQNKKTKKKQANQKELEEYLTQFNLTNTEKNEFVTMLTETNITTLKQKVDTYLAKKIKNKRASLRQELIAYLQGLNITEKDKRNIIVEFNNTNTNVRILKNRANGIAGARQQQRYIQEEGEFINYLNSLSNLTANNKSNITSKLNSYFTDWESLKKSATNLALQRASEKRNKQRTELENYANELGLNNTRKRSLLKKLNNKVSNLITLKREAKKIKNEMNEEARNEKRKNLLRQLTQFNITNENRQELMKQFGTTNNSIILNQAKNLEANKRQTKRDELSLFMSELGLEESDRNLILKNFDVNPKNITLRNKATRLKETRNKEDREKIRRELKEYLNTLNMLNKSNKRKLLSNNTRSYNNVKNEANQLQAQKKSLSERKKQREELVRYLNSLTMLNKNNKQRLLANNSRNITNIKNEANQIQELKKIAKRNAELNTLKKSMNGLNQNSQLYMIDKFETQNVTLKSALKEVEEIKKKIAIEKRVSNRQELIDYMNGLNLGDNDKKKIIKNYDSKKANFGTLKNLATRINATTKNKERQRQELSNYINDLGINGTQLLKKFNDGRSTLNRLKSDANKMRTVANARLVNSKRNQLRTHMKNTRLNDKTKNSFINRVNLNTNMNSLKGEVNNLNTQLKTRDETLSAKKSEMSVFLNTLNELRPENRNAFIAKVVNANTNIEAIKREATNMNQNFKNRKAERKRKEEEEKKKAEERARLADEDRLDRHLRGLKHLTKDEMRNYMYSFTYDGANITNLIATSTAKNKDNEKDKEDLRFYIRNAKIPQSKKDQYLRQLLQPHVNTRPIKQLVNANQERERLATEALKVEVSKKIKKLKTITTEERARFTNNLKTKTPKEVLSAAEKLDKERREGKINRNKTTKNVANQLGKLTNITRNNRVALMKRLPTNGAEKVLANATALNKERKNLKKEEEAKKKADENAKRKKEENKKSGEKEMKNVSSQLQGLTSLTRDNRTNLMKRLPTNGAKKVLANAKKIDQEKKNTEKKTREGVEFKLKKIGVKGSNLQALMKRWNNNKNQTIFDDARKKVEENKERVMAKQPLLNKVLREIPGTFGVFRREWEAAIKKADKPEELQRLDRLLDQKIKLRSEIEKAPIADDKRRGQLRFVMKFSNDIEKRKQELTKDIKAKKSQGDRATAETAKKLQSMNKLGRTNRQVFMKRIADGEDARMVLKNADKLQRNRVAKQKLQSEREKKAQNLKKLKEEGKEKRSNVYKARGAIAKELQKVKELDRSNRVEFMRRVEKGESQNTILRNMSKRIKQRKAEKEMKATKPTTSPLFIPNNSKFPATDNPLAMVPLGNGGDPDINGVRPRLKNVGRRVLQNVKVKKMTNTIKKASETEKRKQNISKLKGPERVAAARNLASKQGRDRGRTAEDVKQVFGRSQSEDERRRLAMLEKQKKAEFRKANRKLARATGQSVKATQKKQQRYRRRKK
jgi:hypothetical protein